MGENFNIANNILRPIVMILCDSKVDLAKSYYNLNLPSSKDYAITMLVMKNFNHFDMSSISRLLFANCDLDPLSRQDMHPAV